MRSELNGEKCEASRHSGIPAAAYAAHGYLLNNGCYTVAIDWTHWTTPDGRSIKIVVDGEIARTEEISR